MTANQAEMGDARVDAAGRHWRPTAYAGIDVCILRADADGGAVALTRFEPGARFPDHSHPGGEDVFVVEGSATVRGLPAADLGVAQGDYFRVPSGGTHDLVAREATVILVVNSGGHRITEPGARSDWLPGVSS